VEAACLTNQHNLPIRLMFQDEARFGRMSDPSSCWAPAPLRPVVNLALVREFKYEYAAVSPWDGSLDYMTADKMNTQNMSRFLKQVSEAHPYEFSVMVLDGASSHKSKDLNVPENVSLVLLPPYSPELNPAEQIWNRLRKNYFANKVFDSLESATLQAEYGLSKMADNLSAMASLTNWPWIKSINLIAN
jgi:transposase